MNKNPAVVYARQVIEGETPAPKTVVQQCREFIDIVDNKNDKYIVSTPKLNKIRKLLSVIIMPDGIAAGKPVSAALAGFQWLLIVATLCVVHRDDQERRRYETALLMIARKNGKTFLIAIIFILLLLLEPRFSQFFSVAPDGQLSNLVKNAMKKIITVSPALSASPSGRIKFRTMRDRIECKITDSILIPLNYSDSRLDGREPTAYLADEVGALPNTNAIEAMKQGQITVSNRLGFIISTRYDKYNNPFDIETDYSKKVLCGVIDDKTRFSLIYEPDHDIATEWTTNDLVLLQANPLAVEVPEILDSLKQSRSQAIEMPSKRSTFLTKHCNLHYGGDSSEKLCDPADLQACIQSEPIDWKGKTVYVGVDLSLTDDNTAVSFVSRDESTGKVLVYSKCFFPADKLEEKSKIEKLDYNRFVIEGNATPCGDKIIDYETVENYIINLADELGVYVHSVGFDRFQALRPAQIVQNAGLNVVFVDQKNRTLSQPLKELTELITQRRLCFNDNELLMINFDNARVQLDALNQKFIHKKKSSGKIDMVAALLNAMYLYQQDNYSVRYIEWGVL